MAQQGVCSAAAAAQPAPASQAPACAQIGLTCWNADVYEPSDDSFALVDALAALAPALAAQPPRMALEIGCGSGYVITSLALLLRQLGGGVAAGCALFATDVSPAALNATAATLAAHEVSGVQLVRTDLAEALLPRLEGRVDLLLFNPPYVPTPDEEVERGGIAAAWAGGDRGRRVIDQLLAQLPALLAPGGQLLMVTVVENDPAGIVRDMEAKGMAGSVVLRRGADEELLTILRLQRPPAAAGAGSVGARD